MAKNKKAPGAATPEAAKENWDTPYSNTPATLMQATLVEVCYGD